MSTILSQMAVSLKQLTSWINPTEFLKDTGIYNVAPYKQMFLCKQKQHKQNNTLQIL